MIGTIFVEHCMTEGGHKLFSVFRSNVWSKHCVSMIPLWFIGYDYLDLLYGLLIEESHQRNYQTGLNSIL